MTNNTVGKIWEYFTCCFLQKKIKKINKLVLPTYNFFWMKTLIIHNSYLSNKKEEEYIMK